MEKKTYFTYKFNELSDQAKEKALQYFRQDSFIGEMAWDTVKEDAKSIGLILQGTDHRDNMTGYFKDYPEDCALAIIANHGTQCETYKTAQTFLDAIEPYAELNDLTHEEEGKLQEIKEEFKRSILEDYRIMYEKEIDYQYSDSALTEMIEANDFDFLENGTLD